MAAAVQYLYSKSEDRLDPHLVAAGLLLLDELVPIDDLLQTGRCFEESEGLLFQGKKSHSFRWMSPCQGASFVRCTATVLNPRQLVLVVTLLMLFSVSPMKGLAQSHKTLVVNADDLGASSGVTNAIVKAYQAGGISSATAIVTGPHSLELIRTAHQQAPTLPIGLHFSITWGKPVISPAQVPTLVDRQGKFYGLDDAVAHTYAYNMEQVKAELQAQIDAFRSTGVPLDHIDFHHHIPYLLPPFFDAYLSVAKANGIKVRPARPASLYLKVKTKTGGGARAAIAEMLKLGIFHPITALRLVFSSGQKHFDYAHRRITEEGLAGPDWFVDGFYENASIENLDSILSQLPDKPGSYELAVHPILPDDAAEEPFVHKQILDAGMKELEVLSAPGFKRTIEAHGFELGTY